MPNCFSNSNNFPNNLSSKAIFLSLGFPQVKIELIDVAEENLDTDIIVSKGRQLFFSWNKSVVWVDRYLCEFLSHYYDMIV